MLTVKFVCMIGTYMEKLPGTKENGAKMKRV